MTNEEILKFAKTCGFDKFQKRNFVLIDGETDYRMQWECWEEQLLKFALAIHEDGYCKGYDDGFDASYIGD